jgi:hypothetical protein
MIRETSFDEEKLMLVGQMLKLLQGDQISKITLLHDAILFKRKP